MTYWTMFAAFLEHFTRFEKFAAGAIGFVIGALAIGWLVRLLTYALTPGKKVPTAPMILIRLLGGVVAGWLAVLLFSGGGGTGFGSGDGFGLGNGNGTNDAVKDQTSAKDDKKAKPRTDKPLEIEVLGDDALRRLAGTSLNRERCYRSEELAGNRLLTLGDVQKKINPDNEAPWRRIKLILYDDSPAAEAGRVDDLKQWIEGLRVKEGGGKIEVIPTREFGNAPSK
jgi:hypothetical protein